jgi:hypothetical protein
MKNLFMAPNLLSVFVAAHLAYRKAKMAAFRSQNGAVIGRYWWLTAAVRRTETIDPLQPIAGGSYWDIESRDFVWIAIVRTP